jgi:hypothetical protein
VAGAGHDDLAWVAGEEYWRTLNEFAILAMKNNPVGEP